MSTTGAPSDTTGAPTHTTGTTTGAQTTDAPYLSFKSLAPFFEGKRSLFVGEGDFGWSTAITRQFGDSPSTSITSSTWDKQSYLESSYANAADNVRAIQKSSSANVLFGVDATKLSLTLPANSCVGKYDTICWMFPHISGKQNIKRNRELLLNFFRSARDLLATDGCILLALAGGQSGTVCASNQDWLHSWKLTANAAEAGLLVTQMHDLDVGAFEEYGYVPQGHRGSGGSFPTDRAGRAQLFSLKVPGYQSSIEGDVEAVQAPICVHEVHLLDSVMHQPRELEERATKAVGEILQSFALDNSSSSAEGYSGALWSVHLVDFYIDPKSTQLSHTLQIAYGSTKLAIGRTVADAIRREVEDKLPSLLDLRARIDKKGGRVSAEHCWEVGRRLKATNGTANPGQLQDTAVNPDRKDAVLRELNVALRELESESQWRGRPRVRIAGDDQDTDDSSGEDDGSESLDGDSEQEVVRQVDANGLPLASSIHDVREEVREEVRRVARGLWRRRVGVLVNQFDLGTQS